MQNMKNRKTKLKNNNSGAKMQILKNKKFKSKKKYDI